MLSVIMPVIPMKDQTRKIARMEQCKITLPTPRTALKAKLYEMGFNTVLDFSKAIKFDRKTVSRVLSGGEYPSRNLQVSMMKALGLSSEEFQRLL